MKWYIEDINSETRREVTIGDYVCFKGDIETSGKIIRSTNGLMVVEVDDGCGNTTSYHIQPKRAWVEW